MRRLLESAGAGQIWAKSDEACWNVSAEHCRCKEKERPRNETDARTRRWHKTNVEFSSETNKTPLERGKKETAGARRGSGGLVTSKRFQERDQHEAAGARRGRDERTALEVRRPTDSKNKTIRSPGSKTDEVQWYKPTEDPWSKTRAKGEPPKLRRRSVTAVGEDHTTRETPRRWSHDPTTPRRASLRSTRSQLRPREGE